MDSQQKYKVLGLMSGTSLDGVDIACCSFSKTNRWKFSIDHANTVSYPKEWLTKLRSSSTMTTSQLAELDVAYGKFLGEACNKFIKAHKIRGIHFIASHGHTLFHQPRKRFTYQLGNGNALHAATGLPVVFDFRGLDVARGGEGAPLVPAGDKFLFDEYDVCLNLGGIANLSYEQKAREAFDVCFVNMGLNYLSQKVGKAYDRGGALASLGEVDKKLLNNLSRVYATAGAKRPSLGREFFERYIQPLLDRQTISINDQLATFSESAAVQIATAIRSSKIKKPTVLCTGGGAFNAFLLFRMMEQGGDDFSLVVPEDEIVKFKEALVFAFLGVLRVRGEVNCLKSVTGASRDSSSGVMVGF